MAQTIRPIADLGATSNFPSAFASGLNNQFTPPVDLWETLNDEDRDTTSGDYTYLRADAASDSFFVVDLEEAVKPESPGNMVIHLSARTLNAYGSPDFGTATTSLVVEVREGYVDESTKGKLIFACAPFNPPDGIGNYSAAEIIFDIPIDENPGTFFLGGFTPFGYLGSNAISNYKNLQYRVYEFYPPTSVSVPTGNDGFKIETLRMRLPQAQELVATNIHIYPSHPRRGEIVGHASTNGCPFVQLLNPTTSPVKLVVYRVGLWAASGGGGAHSGLSRQSAIGIRRTDYPFEPGIGANVAYANVIKLDPNDLSTIYGIMFSMDFTNEQFHNNAGSTPAEFEDINHIDTTALNWQQIRCQWLAQGDSQITSHPTWVRPKGSFPWTVIPGSALEICWLDNGVNEVHPILEWEEVPR